MNRHAAFLLCVFGYGGFGARVGGRPYRRAGTCMAAAALSAGRGNRAAVPLPLAAVKAHRDRIGSLCEIVRGRDKPSVAENTDVAVAGFAPVMRVYWWRRWIVACARRLRGGGGGGGDMSFPKISSLSIFRSVVIRVLQLIC